MRVDFKIAEIADETVLRELRREFQAIESFPKPLDRETDETVLRRLIETEAFGKIWLIFGDGEPAGYLALTFGYSLEYAGRDATIDELYLRENARGRGIGKQAIVFAEEFCKRENVKVVHLEVDEENRAAQNLYYKAGFINYKRYFLTKWID